MIKSGGREMNIFIVIRISIRMIKGLLILLIKLSGVFIIYWLLCNKTNYCKNKYVSHWVYIWSPIMINDVYYWRKWIQRVERGFGSTSETSAFWWQYDLSTLTKEKPTDLK